ncbi:MAG: hypothetical protein Q4B54_14400, partial [Coriobacteriales bacterium]|nr:hypothetical protein [Coriobacteriales bacterium]
MASDIAQRVSRRRRKRNGEKKERNTNHDAKKDRQGNEADDRTQDAEDDDELIPAVVDYEKRTERKRERCAREIDNIEYEERLRNAAIAAETYSFKWFCSLIELESLFDRTGGGREEFTIAFSKVRLEDGMERT